MTLPNLAARLERAEWDDDVLSWAASDLAALLIDCADTLDFAQRHAKESWWANAISDDGEPMGDYPVGDFNDGQNRITALLARLAAFDRELAKEDGQ